MNLFELFVKIGVDDQASGKLKDIGGKLGNGLKTAAKIGTAAVGAAAAGITALTTAAVNNYAEYEQLVGGVETLFKGSADKVQEYAANAYKTAGMSANEYMSTVTSFSASLLQSLGGDTDKAAEYANQALTDMSDNANKMGTSMEMIQNAYQGFAKQNYTMLDNLKLGYGGTKTEMERLIADAAKLDSSIQANDLSFGNIVKAINVVQTEMGITGTTAFEAGRTISGSVGAMKAAWTNLVTGFADGNANIEELINNLVTTIVGDGTENNLGVIGNVLPAVETALGGIVKLVEGAAPKIIEILPGLVEKIVPSLISVATSLVGSLVSVLPDLLKSVTTALTSQSSNIIQTVLDVLLDSGKALVGNAPVLIDAIAQIIDELIMWVGEYSYVFGETAVDLIDALASGIVSNLPTLIETALITIEYFAESLIEMLPEIVKLGLDLIVSLANGIAESLPTLIPTIIDVVIQIVETLINNVDMLVDSAIEIMIALANGLINALPTLIEKAPVIISKLVTALVNNAPKLLEAAWTAIQTLVKGLYDNLPEIGNAALQMIDTLVQGLQDLFWKLWDVGVGVVQSIVDGISSVWNDIVSWFDGLWDGLFGNRTANVTVNKTVTGSGANGSHASGLSYVPLDGYIAALHKGERVLTASEAREYNNGNSKNNTSGITIIQNIQSVPQTPVEFAAATEAYFEQARWAI